MRCPSHRAPTSRSRRDNTTQGHTECHFGELDASKSCAEEKPQSETASLRPGPGDIAISVREGDDCSLQEGGRQALAERARVKWDGPACCLKPSLASTKYPLPIHSGPFLSMSTTLTDSLQTPIVQTGSESASEPSSKCV